VFSDTEIVIIGGQRKFTNPSSDVLKLDIVTGKNFILTHRYYGQQISSHSCTSLKVPKCEIFHLFDFNDFYGIKSV
jgi:hypothetical protein